MLWLVFLLALAWPGNALSKSCSEMKRELARLRLEYHTYATRSSEASGPITFDGLVEILDKIVALKNEMRQSNCKKIPPRPKFPSSKD